MKVALLSHLASPRAPTGAERSLVLLARGLAERGHSVAVAAPGPWVLAAELATAGIEVQVIPCRSCWLTSPAPQPLPLTALRALRYGLPDRGRRKLQRWLQQLQPDVVHVNCLPHLRGAAAARDAGLPVVWHQREILPAGRRRRWFAGRLARDATRIVAVSRAVAAWLQDEGLGDRVEVVHNGVSPAEPLPDTAAGRAALGLAEDDCVVGLFGQVIAHKGALELVRAARLALARQPRLRFLIAGGGPAAYRHRVADEIAGGPHAGRFQLLPPTGDIGELMAATDVVTLTTLTPDPLPRSVLEAMASGRPVVAFRSGGVEEMVLDGETGYLVETGDLRALAERLVILAENAELRHRLGRAGAQRAQRQFSVGRHLDRMEEVLWSGAACTLP